MSKRIKEYNPDQINMITLEPKELFPEGTFERFVVNTFQSMDLNDFLDNKKKDTGGNTEYHPLSILSVVFYALAEGVYSIRKIDKLCIYDQRYIFLSGGQTPHYSTIYRFLKKYRVQIESIFTKILYIADNVGYVDYQYIATDGTKILACAGSKFTGTEKDFLHRQERLSKKITEAIEKQLNTQDYEIKNYYANKQKHYEKDKEKIDNFLANFTPEFTECEKKERKQNITDPDARIMKNKQTFTECYNTQVSACCKHGLIVSNEVTNNANDSKNFKNMVEKTKELAKDNIKSKVNNAKFINDNGYYSAENIIYCESNNIDAYISDGQDKKIFIDGIDENKNFLTNNCYVAEKNNGTKSLFCVGNQELILKKRRESRNEKYMIYIQSDKGKCEVCKYMSKCIKSGKKSREFWIKELIYENYNLVKNMHEKLRTEKGKMIYSKRMPTIEKVFGDLKRNKGITYFTVRGFEKVKLRWSMICSSYNLKRMYNLGLN